jgi:hypothetical protein
MEFYSSEEKEYLINLAKKFGKKPYVENDI